MGKRRRRGYSDAFKAETVRVVRQSGKSIRAMAVELELTESMLRNWMRQASEAGQAPSSALTPDERAELVQLRRDVKRLQMERDILKKATAFFAKEQG
jgi:transposase